MMLPCSGLLVLYFFCKHVHGNDCDCSQMFSPTIGCDIVSNVNDNMGHIMHLQQFIVACEITVWYSRSDTRQPVGSWSNKGGISWITRCPRSFGQDPNPNPKVMTRSRLERSLCITLAPKTPMCMQSLNFDWTGQPVQENKARTTVPTLDSQPVRMAQRRHLMHSTHTSRSPR
jgi:hypothetical protein